MTRLSIGHEAVTSRTETPVAARCVHTLVLTGIPHLTLIDVCWCHMDANTHRMRERKRKSADTFLKDSFGF